MIEIARRKVIYEELHPETVLGASGVGREKVRQNGEPNERFTAATAEATGQSERTVQRAAAIDDLLAYCRKRPDVQERILKELTASPAHGEIGNGRGSENVQAAEETGESRADNVSSTSKHGNGKVYSQKRLKRERPDLAEQVAKGELSANQARSPRFPPATLAPPPASPPPKPRPTPAREPAHVG